MNPANHAKAINKARATEIARQAVSHLSTDHELVIMDDKTVERPFGWVFFYTTRKYLETHDRQYLLPGTAPLVVNREDGSTEYLPTSMPPARAIEHYEKTWAEKHHERKKPAE
jgi:hypothetical protein